MEACSGNIYEELQLLFEDLKATTDKSLRTTVDEKNNDSGDKSQTVKTTQNALQELIGRLDEILTNLSKDDDSFVKLLSMKSSLLYERAKILLSLDDHLGCQSYLEKALDIIDDLNEHPQITYLYLRLMNHLAYVFSRQGKLQKSKEILEKITKIVPSADVKVYSTEELFSNADIDQTDAIIKLNRLTINNLQMLGWVCSKMGLDMEYATQQHRILQYQLNFGECDPVDWASRCARLSILYMSKFSWNAARYHLSAACSILNQLERDMVPHPDLGKAQAELARGWIYYGIRLFDASKTLEDTRRCNEVFDNSTLEEAAAKTETKEEEEPLDPNLIFTGCDVKVEDIPASPVKSTEGARTLFFQTHIWLKRARLFYTLRDHPYIYVNCVLDLSELYRYLAYFEADLESQYNVQKRRADALETLSGLLKDVRPQCYISVSVEILRELAEVHLELMGLNLKRMYQVQGIAETQDSLRKRIDAVSEIHNKLDSFGNILERKNREKTTSQTVTTEDDEEEEEEETGEISLDDGTDVEGNEASEN